MRQPLRHRHPDLTMATQRNSSTPGSSSSESGGSPQLDALTILTGSETLLVNEALDTLRQAAERAGCADTRRLTLDARSDWSQLQEATQSLSLFGGDQLVIVQLPSGRPGRTGGDALQQLAAQAQNQQLAGTRVIVVLPALDRATRQTKWAKTLLGAGTVLTIQTVTPQALPEWIQQRLSRQKQSTDRDTLAWIAERVEGNLLAAHQEIQKLGLLYPEGVLSQEQVQTSVLDVARYNVFALRDAMLAGQARRSLRILEGLQAEGQAAPLVLWAIGDEIRLLARLAAASQRGNLRTELQRHRVFGQRERLMQQALQRVNRRQWPAAVRHAHDIDKLIKGLQPKGRLTDPWAEMAQLVLRVTGFPASGSTNRLAS